MTGLVVLLLACHAGGDEETGAPAESGRPGGAGDDTAACEAGAPCDDDDACTTADACADDGTCSGAPVRCDAPPDATCVDATTLRTWGSTGTCADGACTYEPIDTTCEGTCEEGACVDAARAGELRWMATASSDLISEAEAAGLPGGDVVVLAQAGTEPFVMGSLRLDTSFGEWVLARLDPQGGVVWARRLASEGTYGELAVADDGGVYVALVYDGGPVGLLPDTTEPRTLPDAGAGADSALLRLDADGELGWVVHLGNDQPDVLLDLDALPDGGVAVTGYFGGELTLGAGEADETTLSGGETDPLIARYRADGTLVWAWGSKNDESVWPQHLVASSDRLFVAGSLRGTMTLPDGSVIGERGHEFIAALTLDGALLWATELSGAGLLNLMGLGATPDGGVITTAITAATNGEADVVLAPGEAEETTLDVIGFRDALLAGWDADGRLAWVRTAHGEPTYGVVEPMGLAGGPDGDVLVVGLVEGATSWDDGTGGSYVDRGADRGSSDIAYALYDAAGQLLYASSAGGGAYDAGITAGWSEGGPLVLGGFGETSTFARGEAGETQVRATGYRDLCVLGLAP